VSDLGHNYNPGSKFRQTTVTYLHSAQLIKHILGLKTACGKDGFKLLYLWYDVFGREGAIHRDEIEKFAGVVRTDGVHFDAKSYQELILAMSNEYRSDHTDYSTFAP